jgi:NADH-quinone oxidoreductase subunit L
MVASGVYLLARVFPILTPDAKLFLAMIGAITLTMGALIAIVQTDIKKVLAFAVMSQLGFMMLAMGVGSWVGGLFHLMTHAFFMSLLFLGAGSVIRVARYQQEMGGFGGLLKRIPVTGITFLIGVLAIAGVGYAGIGLSGYYSKGMILAQAGAFADLAIHQGHSRGYVLLYIVPMVVGCVMPFIVMRCWMLSFWGKSRAIQEYDDAAERPIMWGALIVLAILAALSGRMLSIKEMLEGSLQESNAYCRQIDPNFSGFDTIWPGELPVDRGIDLRGIPDVMTPSQNAQLDADAKQRKREGLWSLVGLLVTFGLYDRGTRVTKSFLRVAPLRWIRQWLFDRMYFDELYSGVFVSSVQAVSAVVAWIDRVIFSW